MKKLCLLLLLGTAACQQPSHTASTATDSVKTDKKVASRYVCPMHPEVVANKPGTCPKCGMDLVKK